jgi:hypothetical protein
MTLAEAAWRNADPNADGEAPLGVPGHLAWIAWDFVLICSHSESTAASTCPAGSARRPESPLLGGRLMAECLAKVVKLAAPAFI